MAAISKGKGEGKAIGGEGYCTQWTSSGHCSRGELFSFKHDLGRRAGPPHCAENSAGSTQESGTGRQSGKNPTGRFVLSSKSGILIKEKHWIIRTLRNVYSSKEASATMEADATLSTQMNIDRYTGDENKPSKTKAERESVSLTKEVILHVNAEEGGEEGGNPLPNSEGNFQEVKHSQEVPTIKERGSESSDSRQTARYL